jgi:hypothetical protein
MNGGLNKTTGEITISLPSIGGMSRDTFLAYCIVNGVLFVVIIGLLCIYRLDYFHVIGGVRLEREIEKAERQYESDVLRFGELAARERDQ